MFQWEYYIDVPGILVDPPRNITVEEHKMLQRARRSRPDAKLMRWRDGGWTALSTVNTHPVVFTDQFEE